MPGRGLGDGLAGDREADRERRAAGRARSAARSGRRWPRRTRGDRQAEPGPGSGVAAAAEERLEHVRALLPAGIPRPWSVTRTVTCPADAAGDPDRRVRRRELDRVLDQVREHALELRGVGADERQVGRQRELDRVLGARAGRPPTRRRRAGRTSRAAARPRPPRSATGRAGRRRAWRAAAPSPSITSISSVRSASVTPRRREAPSRRS